MADGATAADVSGVRLGTTTAQPQPQPHPQPQPQPRQEEEQQEQQEQQPLLEHHGNGNGVPLRTLAAFGAGEFGLYIIAIVQGFFLLEFLLEVAGVRAGVAAALVLVIHVIDAVSDPLVGMLSDSTHTRWGKRRPWLLLGALPLAVSWFFTWQVPAFLDGSDTLKAVYYTCLLCAVNMFYTVVGVPYVSLTPELAATYNDRTSLTTARFVGGLSAGVLSASFWSFAVEWFAEGAPAEREAGYRRGYTLGAAVTSPVVVVCILITVLGVRERKRAPVITASRTLRERFTETLRALVSPLRSRMFLALLATAAMCFLVINFIQANLFLFVKWVLLLEEHFTYILLEVQLSIVLSLVPLNLMSQRFGKRLTFYLGMTVGAGVLVSLYFVPAGNVPLLYAWGACAGVVAGVGLLLPWSMLPDYVDLDELQHGARREGALYGIFMVFQKVGLGLALGASSLVLDLAGFQSPSDQEADGDAHQPESVVRALRIMITFAPLACIAVAFVALAFYRMGRDRLFAVQLELERRHGGAREPLLARAQAVAASASVDAVGGAAGADGRAGAGAGE